MPTLPDVGETGVTEGFEESKSTSSSTSADETTLTDDQDQDEETTLSEADEESYFSDRARWKRGGIIDPEANDW